MGNISDYFGGGGGGALVEISAVAEGAVPNGSPCIQLGDGKVAAPAGNVPANVVDHLANCQLTNNSQYYTFYNGITFVDRAAGRGIILGQQGSPYNFNGLSKLWTVNTTTGAGTGNGAGQNSFNYPTGSAETYMEFPIGAIWDSDTNSWFCCYRRNSTGQYNLVMCKAKTTNGYTQTAGYKHNFGASNQYAITSGHTGTTRFIEARGYKYLITVGNTQAYGRDSCMVHGPFTWSSDANDGGAFAATALSTQYVATGYNYTADAVYDSANEQIVVVTGGYTSTVNQTLHAFDVAANGTVTYSHGLADAGGSTVTGSIRSLATDTLGNLVWSDTGSEKLYAAINNGSAFTKGNSINWPSGVYAQISMAYSSTVKNFVASYILSTGQSQSPIHFLFTVSAGNLGATTKQTDGTGAQYGTYNSYVGYTTYPNSTNPRYIGGNYVYTTDTFYQFNLGNADSNTISEVNSNIIATSNTFTGSYIGLAKAAISNGASGKITTKGAINESQSGLSAGIRYAMTSDGTVKTESSVTDTESPNAIFLGTATSPTAMLVGDSLTVVDNSATNKKVPKSLLKSGNFTQRYQENWTTALTAFSLNTENVSATGTASIFKATGKGTVLYFLMANSSGNSQTNVDVFIDGLLLFNTGTFSTGGNYCLSLIGEWAAGATNDGGSLAATSGYQFNKSFEVRRNVNCTATSFTLGYKILSY